MMGAIIKKIGLAALAAGLMNLAALGITLPPGVTLAWDPSSGVAGYRVYLGTASGNYGANCQRVS